MTELENAIPTAKPRLLGGGRRRNGAIIAGVLGVHLGLMALAGLTDDPPPIIDTPIIEVELVRPIIPPPPPPPPAPPAKTQGGGAPGASSPVRLPDRVVERPREIVAPPIPTPAPTPPPAIGVSPYPVANPAPGLGQGGEGTGEGTGSGSGSGPGAGRGSTPPRIVRGPSQGDLRSVHPQEALRAGRSGQAVISCLIRADQHLHRCTVVSARPEGQGFDEAGLLATRFYRFQPPTRDGEVRTDQPVTITVQFGRPR